MKEVLTPRLRERTSKRRNINDSLSTNNKPLPLGRFYDEYAEVMMKIIEGEKTRNGTQKRSPERKGKM